MRLYHFVDAQYGLQDIRQRHLKIARINELNDPFELLGVASRDQVIRRRYLDLKTGLAEFMGLLCFSGGWTNPVQWSHYADRHRGLCLGFDVNAPVHRVKYVKYRLKPDSGSLRQNDSAAQKYVMRILTTKFEHWRYEDEYRVFPELKVKDERGLYFFEFGKEFVLREVIVGHNSTITRAELDRALGDLTSSVTKFKARLAFQSFRVVRQLNDEMWA